MWVRAVVAGAAGWLAAGAVATAQSGAGTFPTSLDREPLLSWLRSATDIDTDRIVAVTPQAVTAVVSIAPAAGAQAPRAIIRAEALNPDTVARTGALSWQVPLTADCKGGRVRLGENMGHAQRNLRGERKVLRAAEADWRTPEPGTALDYAWRVVCQADFIGPFGTRPLRAALAPPAQTAAATRPPATASAPRPVARGAAPAAQVGASTSESDARGLLAALASTIGGRETWVETATVAGRTWRRAMVGGFADAGEASAFCAGLKAAGRDCLVRSVTR